jgi:hypothetical protein
MQPTTHRTISITEGTRHRTQAKPPSTERPSRTTDQRTAPPSVASPSSRESGSPRRQHGTKSTECVVARFTSGVVPARAPESIGLVATIHHLKEPIDRGELGGDGRKELVRYVKCSERRQESTVLGTTRTFCQSRGRSGGRPSNDQRQCLQYKARHCQIVSLTVTKFQTNRGRIIVVLFLSRTR